MTSPKPSIETKNRVEKQEVKAPENMKQEISKLKASTDFEALKKQISTKEIIEESEKKYTEQISTLDISKNPETDQEKDAFHTFEVTTLILIQNIYSKLGTKKELLKTPEDLFSQGNTVQLSQIEKITLTKLQTIYKNNNSPLRDVVFSGWNDSINIIENDVDKNLSNGFNNVLDDWEKKNTFEKMTTLGKGFFETYKTPLLVGGGIIGAIWLGRKLFHKDGGNTGNIFSFKNFLIGGGIAALGFLGLSNLGKFGDMFGGLFGGLDKAKDAIAKAKAAEEKAKEELEKMKQKVAGVKEAVNEAGDGVKYTTINESLKKIGSNVENYFEPIIDMVDENKAAALVTSGLLAYKFPGIGTLAVRGVKMTVDTMVQMAKLPIKIASKHPILTLFALGAAIKYKDELNPGNIQIPKDPENFKKWFTQLKDGFKKDDSMKEFIEKNELQKSFSDIDKYSDQEIETTRKILNGEASVVDYLPKLNITNIAEKTGDALTLTPEKYIANQDYNGIHLLQKSLKREQTNTPATAKKYDEIVTYTNTLLSQLETNSLTNDQYNTLEEIISKSKSGIKVSMDQKTHFINVNLNGKEINIGIDPSLSIEKKYEAAKNFYLKNESLLDAIPQPLTKVIDQLRLGGGELMKDIKSIKDAQNVVLETIKKGGVLMWDDAFLTLKGATETYVLGPTNLLWNIFKGCSGMNVNSTEALVDYGNGIVPVMFFGTVAAISNFMANPRIEIKNNMFYKRQQNGVLKFLVTTATYPVKGTLEIGRTLKAAWNEKSLLSLITNPALTFKSDFFSKLNGLIYKSQAFGNITSNRGDVLKKSANLGAMYEAMYELCLSQRSLTSRNREQHLINAENILSKFKLTNIGVENIAVKLSNTDYVPKLMKELSEKIKDEEKTGLLSRLYNSVRESTSTTTNTETSPKTTPSKFKAGAIEFGKQTALNIGAEWVGYGVGYLFSDKDFQDWKEPEEKKLYFNADGTFTDIAKSEVEKMKDATYINDQDKYEKNKVLQARLMSTVDKDINNIKTSSDAIEKDFAERVMPRMQNMTKEELIAEVDKLTLDHDENMTNLVSGIQSKADIMKAYFKTHGIKKEVVINKYFTLKYDESTNKLITKYANKEDFRTSLFQMYDAVQLDKKGILSKAGDMLISSLPITGTAVVGNESLKAFQEKRYAEATRQFGYTLFSLGLDVGTIASIGTLSPEAMAARAAIAGAKELAFITTIKNLASVKNVLQVANLTMIGYKGLRSGLNATRSQKFIV